MAEPTQISDAPPGGITATPARVLRKLGIKVFRVRGVVAGRRRRR